MSGQVDQAEFADILLAGTGKTPISITAAVTQDDMYLPDGTIKKCWCVSFLMIGDGFSIPHIIKIGHQPSCQKTAEKIVSQINNWVFDRQTMIDALGICLPDSAASVPDLEPWQRDVINNARKIVEADHESKK